MPQKILLFPSFRFVPVFAVIVLLGTGCLGSRVAIPPEAKPLYDQGLALYDTGDYAGAEQRFRRVLERDGSLTMARYWLGMSLYEQRKNDDALRLFLQIRSSNGKLPHGYYGLGLVSLRMKNRRLEAVQWFREALRRDSGFVDAQWQLAVTRLALSRGLFGAFSIEQVRDEFRRIIRLAPEHPQAYYTLALTYSEFGIEDDAGSGIPLFERQIVVTPDHRDARYQLGLAYIDMDRIDEGIAMLESARPSDPERSGRIDRAVAEAKLRNRLVRGDSVFQTIRLLPEAERRLYYDLSHVLSPDASFRAEALSLEEAGKRAFDHWRASDPIPETGDNERLEEHCRRVAYARRHFGRGMWPWDRRGEVYIRYGEPASRETSISSAGDTDTGLTGVSVAQFGVRQVQRWVYRTPPLQFDFVDQGANFVFDTPFSLSSGDISALAREAMYDQNARLDDMMRRAPSVYSDQIEHGPPLRFSYSLAVFRGVDGRPELEVDYAIPAIELTFRELQARIETAIVVFDSEWREEAKVVEDKRIETSGDEKSRKYETALYRRTVSVPPGAHQFALRLTDAESKRSGVLRQGLTTDAFPAGRLAMSDLRLASLVSAGGGAFVRGGRRIVPNPAAVFSRTRPVTLYYEVYNLLKNAAGRMQLTIEYTVYPLAGSDPPVFSVVGGKVTRPVSDRAFSLIQDEEGTEETLYRDIGIDMGQANPGRYAIQVTVTDLHRQESVDKTVLFRLVE
ncbi:MAG: tetratricopeptide repeat protein [candidate division Zixibacteria bacterium]|nr:tetratricopeptide repeat protein [candidate division Zixibacteria bacterium]